MAQTRNVRQHLLLGLQQII
ncbi:hypothetical protein MAR_013711 [Mya arenaria]|uniref:Uncharacterized protein n=1 Tax=Mya arenaria TaxID=6604 RepID=A0ABY7G271_MYAAR|nr:hypothetical protein MAR_013711 [Mya arenaria]